MNIISFARATSFVVTGLLVLAVPVAQGHPCDRDPSPDHRHCSGPGDGLPSRIPGCATFDPGLITTDGGGTYCDADPTTDYRNNQAAMQVAMNCTSNHFNVYPGGGDRRIRLDIYPSSVSTEIDSCEGVPLPIDFVDTDMSGLERDCDNTDPDWAFDQLMRAEPSGSGNVCELSVSESLNATMRFQNNLYHLNSCNGGTKKCGTSLEALEVNYDGDACSAPVTITCTAETAGQCTDWTISSTGPGCLTHGSGGAGTSEVLPFSVNFKAD